MPPRTTRRTKPKEEPDINPKPDTRTRKDSIPNGNKSNGKADLNKKPLTRAPSDRKTRVPVILPIPPPSPEPQDPKALPPATYTKDRGDKITDRDDQRTAQAWPIGKYPTSRYILRGDPGEKKVLSLPRAYHGGKQPGKKGSNCQHLTVYAGEDLNYLVWKWYGEIIDEKELEVYEGLQNYVEGGVVAKRHEYLGPSPLVAGYSLFGAEEMRIEWYDSFLKDKWVEKDNWTVDMDWIRGRWREVPR